ncbi:coniferyl aldehyde dehydrogenase [Luteibacter sp. 22Crub2.1]|uniref:coniferyl aldehyde dehydrogenase n=1 Tax=Luteibacter sp. 22Crub2.1 TaxID=1283288 RepID=UPI0009A7A8E2|nr:coniferyl aldehyde dehydrogenase [Luteibacter sp. 22Crub2.1]SKB84446.1 coniferyl-aldehyde dehydrogenase [Luteibacter sp. 22Crub2.1]
MARSYTRLMLDTLQRQKATQLAEGPPSASVRIDRLDRAIGLLVDHASDITDALREDFGHRSVDASMFTDVAASIEPLKHAKRHLRRWMRRERRPVSPAPLALIGARAWIDYQPKGVVGVISPWNFPFNLTFAPLAGILAAGNRAMIKPSEFTPRSSALMQRMIGKAFNETEVAVFTGGSDVGEAFSRLPFDHLLFTGATSVAKHIMRAAAENLVPVTLELGGKSPAIVGRDADLELAARRLLFGKTLNAGQVCVSPDYALVPRKHVDAFVDALSRSVASMFPTLRDNPDYTSIVNERHHGRLLGYLDDARAKGATLRVLGRGDERFDDRRIAPTVVLGADDSMDIMRDEIFGPLLPILPYDDIDGAVDYINAHARPLALYYFGNDTGEQERVLAKTVAGGVTINDTVMHLAMDDLPFGGIGPSGMGAYHGHDGFLTFSHARSVYRQARFDVTAMLRPPYGTTIKRLLSLKIRR